MPTYIKGTVCHKDYCMTKHIKRLKLKLDLKFHLFSSWKFGLKSKPLRRGVECHAFGKKSASQNLYKPFSATMRIIFDFGAIYVGFYRNCGDCGYHRAIFAQNKQNERISRLEMGNKRIVARLE